jgi:hypothetical protein
MSTPSMAAIAAPSMVAIDRARRLNRTREARQRAARLIVARYQPGVLVLSDEVAAAYDHHAGSPIWFVRRDAAGMMVADQLPPTTSPSPAAAAAAAAAAAEELRFEELMPVVLATAMPDPAACDPPAHSDTIGPALRGEIRRVVQEATDAFRDSLQEELAALLLESAETEWALVP